MMNSTLSSLHAIVLLAIVLFSRTYCGAQGKMTVRISAGEILVPVEIRHHTFNFLLDTGSTDSAIDSGIADNLGLKAQGTTEILKNFRKIDADAVELESLKLGTAVFRDLKLATMNLAPVTSAVGVRVDGVLANDILKRVCFKLSYSSSTLLFGPLDTLGRLGRQIPLHRSSGQFLVDAVLLSTTGEFVLDTGTNSTDISWKIWQEMTKNWMPDNVIEGVARAGNPTSAAILACVPKITIGKFTLRNQAIRAQRPSDQGAFSSEDFAGILGSDILRRFEVTFDLSHHRIFLARDLGYKPDPYRYSSIGVQIGRNDHGAYQVMSVWKDTPAAIHDLHEGDILEAVNDERLNAMTIQDIAARLHAKPGTAIKLTVARGTEHLEMTLHTRQLLCAIR